MNSGNGEQTQRIRKTEHAIAELEQVTQRTTASADRAGRAATELVSQSDAMKGIADELLQMAG